MKIIKTITGLFTKLNTLKEWFGLATVLGDIIDYAAKRFEEYEKTIE